MPQGPQGADRLDGVRPCTLSLSPTSAHNPSSSPHSTTVSPARLQGLRAPLDLGRVHVPLVRQAVTADPAAGARRRRPRHRGLASAHARSPAPTTRTPRPQGADGAAPSGCSLRDSIAASQESTSRSSRPPSGSITSTLGSPCVTTPVLSKATTRDSREFLQCLSPLHEDAGACGRRQRRHDGDRRRDDEGTRAGDQDCHQRAIEPLAPRPRAERGGDDGNHQGDAKHGRRVDTREPLDPLLGARALEPCGLDER